MYEEFWQISEYENKVEGFWKTIKAFGEALKVYGEKEFSENLLK